MKIYKLLLVFLGISLGLSMSAQSSKTLSQARIYINPGHGGWGSNDRPMATINYEVKDTLGFFETNTNMLKAEALRDGLAEAGAGFIKMSRTRNGVITEGDPQTTPNDIFREGDVIGGVTQIVTLSVIAMDVETNNMDYFLSIHSNAAGEGALTNYPLLLYRGTDTEVGNGLTDARNMALDAWKYIIKNGITYHSHYAGATDNNTRGDISFQSGSSTTTNGYTGFYGVLRHGCDGFLSEGCFHTYQPERQRLLNKDYCRQEGVRYARAIRAWFGDTSSKTTGDIMGTVKDKYEVLTHTLYKYKSNSVDAHKPLNEVTVVLQNSQGATVDSYTTDKEYNGVYVFTGLTPGTYTLVYDIPEYEKKTETIEVVANQTAFINTLVDNGSIPPPPPFLDAYYPTPVQDGDIAAAESYKFATELNLTSLDALKDLTIRRAILRNNKYYVLAHDAAKSPKLLVINPETGDLIKEMSTEGVVTTGYNGKAYPYILSDIAFTTDGVLVGANSTVVGKESNAYQTGDFYLYKWQGTESVALEDAKPAVIIKLPTNTSASLANAGNNNSNFMANSIAVKGGINDFFFYFDSHAGNAWTTTYGLNFMAWRVENGVIVDTQRNTTSYTESTLGADVRMTYSPLGDVNDKDLIHRFILDGNNIEPREMKMNWATPVITENARFSATIPSISTGANYFRYAGKVYMSAPVCEKQADDKYSYKVYLFDITDGLDNAKQIGVTDAVITDQANVMFMASNGVVDNADINQYLLVGNNIVKYTTKGQMTAESIARIFAYDLVSTKTATGYDISYSLNEDANAVGLVLLNGNVEEKTIPLSGLSKGTNTVSILFNDIPDGSEFTWAIKASAGNVTRFVKLSDDSKAYRFFGPKGVAVDKSPESKYFGRVYITNSDAGTNAERTTSKGVYILGADGSDVTTQGDNAHNGGLSWASTAGESPRKVAVAADGRVFVCDFSVANSGIYNLNPETYTMSPVFAGATRAADGKLTIGGTYVGGQTAAIGFRGEGANTQLYTVDRSAGSAWSKFVATYNIGEAATITGAPVASVKPSSFIGNDNSSIAPVATGFWAGQYRGAGSNTAANPCMFYYSDEAKEAVFNTKDFIDIPTSSQNGALAVNEKEGVIALSNNAGASIYAYTMNEKGIPVVVEKFSSKLASTGVTYDDFEFDYAGNLYAVSYSGKLVSVWAMPTSDNTSVVPAQVSMILKNDVVGIDLVKDETTVKVYPNPTTDVVTVESPVVINTIEIYSVAGALLNRINNVGAESVTVDFNRYAQGVYFVRVNGGKSIKVIKK